MLCYTAIFGAICSAIYQEVYKLFFRCYPVIVHKLVKEIKMNMNMLLVKAMHYKFGIDRDSLPEFTEEENLFRIAAMMEELSEFTVAKTDHEKLDALVDLVVFALGTAERLGYADIFDTAFSRVMKANMSKTVGANKKRGSFAVDLVKPKDWVEPRFDDLLEDRVSINDLHKVVALASGATLAANLSARRGMKKILNEGSGPLNKSEFHRLQMILCTAMLKAERKKQ